MGTPEDEGLDPAGGFLQRHAERIHLRNEAVSAKQAEWTSDPTWEPPCDDCVKLKWERGIPIVVPAPPGSGPEVRGLRLPIPCPRRSDPSCRLEKRLLAERTRHGKERYEAFMRGAGIGSRYWYPDERRLGEKEIVGDFCAGIADEVTAGHGILLTGPTGTGKTSILAHIAGAAFVAGIERTLYSTVSRLMSALAQRQLLEGVWGEPWIGADLLLLDDLGVAYESDFTWALFEDFVEARYGRLLSTCLSTNLSVADLREVARYERILDRFREVNRGVVVGGDSLRLPDWRADE